MKCPRERGYETAMRGRQKVGELRSLFLLKTYLYVVVCRAAALFWGVQYMGRVVRNTFLRRTDFEEDAGEIRDQP